MATEWIDWLALVTNGLWVTSLAGLIAIIGFRVYLGAITNRMVLFAWAFGALMCIGLGFSLGMPFQKLMVAIAGIFCVYQVLVHLRLVR